MTTGTFNLYLLLLWRGTSLHNCDFLKDADSVQYWIGVFVEGISFSRKPI